MPCTRGVESCAAMNIFQFSAQLKKRPPEESLRIVEQMEKNLAARPPLTPEQRAQEREMDRIMALEPVRPARKQAP